MRLQVRCPNPACSRTLTIEEIALLSVARCLACGRLFTAEDALSGSSSLSEVPQSPDALRDGFISQAIARPLPPGTPLQAGRYQIRARLGTGAFGTVYLAHDPWMNRWVALKLPHASNLQNPRHRERFLAEARAIAGLSHPRIVRIYDAACDDSQAYIASAFIEAQSLARVLARTNLDFPRAADIVRQLADALAYAHQMGILHRDVKPANILLDDQGQAHLVDFGLAYQEDAGQQLTALGAIMGTPSYMAPEQAAGKHGDPHPASDQYSLGVVFYELLCGEPPFRGPPPIILYNTLHHQPDPPRQRNPAIPAVLERICLKALEKRPEDRYPGCHEMAAALNRWLEGETIPARPPDDPSAPIPFSQVPPAVPDARTFMPMGAASPAGGGSVSLPNGSTQVLAPDLVSALGPAKNKPARSGPPRWRPRPFFAIGALLLGGLLCAFLFHSLWAGKRFGEEHLLLTFRGHTASVGSVTYTRDGSHIASASKDDTVKLWDARSGREVATLPHTGVLKVAYSSDGSRIASVSDKMTVKVWDASSGAEIRTLNLTSKDVDFRTFSPDGSRLAAVVQGLDRLKTVKVWDASTGAEILTLQPRTTSAGPMAFSPDGSRLASYVWRWVSEHPPVEEGVVFEQPTVKVWDARRGTEILTIRPQVLTVCSVAFSPDGSRLATCEPEGIWGGTYTVKLRDAKSGTAILTLLPHTGVVSHMAFSPDSSRLATAEWNKRTVKVWDARGGSELATLRGHTDWVTSVAYSPDGSRIASASQDGTVKVWDARSTGR
jgi:serine/threonine protein kinase